MLYLVSKEKMRDPRILAMLDREAGETYEEHVWSNVVRPDDWRSVTARNPGQPWKHVRELYGTHEGKDILVLGSGPSLLQVARERERLQRSGWTVLAINRAIRMYQARYWLTHDYDAFTKSQDHENAQRSERIVSIQLYEKFRGSPCTMIEVNGQPLRWRKYEDRPLYWNETTLGWALHLALRMGARRIYTLGTELSLDGTYDGFLQEGRSVAWLLAQHYGVRERMLEMFRPEEKIQWYERPVEIIDLSGGALPVPKMRLEEALERR